MNYVSIVIGAVGGLLWGFCGAVLNQFIMKKAIASKSQKKVMNMMLVRMAVDVIWLAAVFVLRNSKTINFLAALVATAAALSMLTIYFTFKLAGTPAPDDKKQ